MYRAGIVEAFSFDAQTVASLSELAILVEDVARDLGFDHFALLHHAALERGSGHGLIKLDTYPDEWKAQLETRRLLGADPVHQASFRTHVGFAWSELPQIVRLGRREQQLLDLAPRFGILDGFTIPVNVPGEPSGSCSFAIRPGRALPGSSLLAAEQIGSRAFRAARRLAGYAARAQAPRLAPRERQCVQLIAAGKTDWEIAAILDLSIHTVQRYIKRARAAYDVVSRAQLVVCGLRDAIVTF